MGEYRWFEVALYWIYLIGSIVFAYTNWRLNAIPRTGAHLSIYAMGLVSAGL